LVEESRLKERWRDDLCDYVSKRVNAQEAQAKERIEEVELELTALHATQLMQADESDTLHELDQVKNDLQAAQKALTEARLELKKQVAKTETAQKLADNLSAQLRLNQTDPLSLTEGVPMSNETKLEIERLVTELLERGGAAATSCALMREELGWALFLRFKLGEEATRKGINPKPYILPEVDSAITECQLGDFRGPHRADPIRPNVEADHALVDYCRDETDHRRVRKMAISAYGAYEAPAEARRPLAQIHPDLASNPPLPGSSPLPAICSSASAAQSSSVAKGGNTAQDAQR
jgi:hypothetical protein